MWPSPATGTFPHSFKQLEHYTFYGLVATIPKEVPILGAETRVLYDGGFLRCFSDFRKYNIVRYCAIVLVP